MYKEIIRVGNVVGGGKSQGGNTYLTIGISPTLLSGMSHGNVMPFIVEIERVDKDDYRKIKSTKQPKVCGI